MRARHHSDGARCNQPEHQHAARGRSADEYYRTGRGGYPRGRGNISMNQSGYDDFGVLGVEGEL